MQMSDGSREVILRRVTHWAAKLRVQPRLVRVQRMTRKWGSCSTSGVVTLATDLAEQRPQFVDFVIAHELLHLRVPNHGKMFKALMTLHVPQWRQMNLQRLREGRLPHPNRRKGVSTRAL